MQYKKFTTQKLITTLGLILSFNTQAITSCDVYGITPERAENLLKKYQTRIGALEDNMYKIYLGKQTMPEKIKLLTPLVEQKQKLTQQITHDEKFLYVDIGSTYYPHDHSL